MEPWYEHFKETFEKEVSRSEKNKEYTRETDISNMEWI